VREALDKSQGAPPETLPETPPSRRDFEDPEGRTWTAEVAGRGRSGQVGDPGAPLLLILFRPPPGDPERGDVLEALAVGSELDDLSDDRLGELVRRATPMGFEPGEFFPDTRRGRGGS
jgi:hypothetical protein